MIKKKKKISCKFNPLVSALEDDVMLTVRGELTAHSVETNHIYQGQTVLGGQ